MEWWYLFPISLALYGLHRGLSAAESRGWIYYRQKPGLAGRSLASLFESLQPTRAVHVQELRRQGRKVQNQALAEPLARAQAQGLTVNIVGDYELLDERACAFVEEVLRAAQDAQVADVTLQVTASLAECEVSLQIRAVDRSLVERFAKALNISTFRHDIEAVQGKITAAHSKFARFHLTFTLPWR